MGIIQEITTQNLKEKGLEGLGATMPFVSNRWVDTAGGTIAGSLELTNDTHRLRTTGGGTFRAPLPALVQLVNADNPIDVTLMAPDGNAVSGPGFLCSLLPQAYLRLQRLAARHFENDNAHNPLKAQGIPLHPVPRHYFIKPGAMPADARGGMIRAGETIGAGGDLDFFDADGHWIHPLMVASMLSRLSATYTILKIGTDADSQFTNLIGLAAEGRRVRIVNQNGSPYLLEHFEGFTPIHAASALHTVDAYTGSDTAVVGEVKRKAATADNGGFPPKTATRTLIRHAAYGRLGATVTLPAQPIATALQHDFYTLVVNDLNQSLLGTRPNAFNGVKLEPAPMVRVHENLRLLANGNAVMAGAAAVFNGSTNFSMAVAPRLEPQFRLPPHDFSSNTWPTFPPADVIAADDADFPADIRQQIMDRSNAHYVTPASGAPVDVQLNLKGLPKASAVRVYTRIFGFDAVLSRGDGAGGVVNTEDSALTSTFKGTTSILLRDPLRMVRPDGSHTVPTSPLLIVDMVIVQRSGKKRHLGSLEWNVAAAAAGTTTAPAANAADSATQKGVCRAGILGNPPVPLPGWPTNGDEWLNLALTLAGETQPRDASRLPTMARRELLMASRTGSAFKGLLSAGPYNPAMHCAHPLLGGPGGQGGKETSLTGIYAEDNRTAFDLARAAFRRTRFFGNRIVDLYSDDWNEPAEKTALGETDTPSGGRGSMHAAVLQTIAPFCETPELALFKSLVEANINNIPADFNALVDLVVGWIDGLGGGQNGALGGAVDQLKNAVKNALNGLKDNNPLNESKRERVYNELKRELSAACYGRRDAQWAIEEAIKQARHFIYLETPGFSFTHEGGAVPIHARDLIQAIKDRQTAVPGLKVVICTPKAPDYAFPGYIQWVAREVERRFNNILSMDDRQTVAFHPIGFPGRPANIETTTMIVDDQWALIGASAFRRRGLTFDGSTDIAFTDGDQVGGAANSIKALRVALLRQRLGLEQAGADHSGAMQLHDMRAAFRLIRETLVAGGLGRIERLWNGREDHIPYSAPTINNDLANPEGLTFNTLEAAVAVAFIGSLTGV